MEQSQKGPEWNRAIPFWRQMRWQVIITCLLLAIVPMLITAIIINQRTAQQTTQATYNRLESVAELKRQQIQDWITNSSAALEVLLSPPVTANILTFATTNATTQQADPQINTILSAATTQPISTTADSIRFKTLFLYTPQGRIIAASDPVLIGRIVARQPYFEPSLAQDHIQPPFYEVGNNELVMIVTHPILDAAGQTSAVIGGEVDLSVLGQIMLRRTGLGESGETYLVSQESHYLLTPSRLEGYPLTQAYHSEGIDQGLKGQDGRGSYGNYHNPPTSVVGVYRWVPELQAVLMAEISRDEAFASANRSQQLTLIIMLVTSLIAMLLGLFVATRITTPLTTLTKTAARIAGGDLDQRVHLRQHNEIGVLAEGFNSMSGRLQETLQGLEERVAERTKALEDSLHERDKTVEELHETMRARQILQETIRAVSSPVLPVLDDVLVMPLIGTIDSERAALLTETLLHAIDHHRARIVILDVTGVPVIDSQVAQALLNATQAARLLGAAPILAGMRPELAQTIVGLGIDLSSISTHADLQSSIRYAVSQRRSRVMN